ncbi:hypothetical protein PIB30_083510 [Stylosanthes scabra]|uniref:Uncharacterized protein n=1 Tax=Stylosanthes scabra TaxID=79078 RepID=A0ABU6VQS5_9FABA|nr:hypothetical protein [Stylosanthes scabra]
MIATTGRRRVPFSTALMHSERMRLQALQVMLRTLQRCTVSSVGHQHFPPRVPEPRHEIRTHVSNATRMEKGPRLGHLRLNECKGNRQDIVVPIFGHCDQQNPPVFSIQVGPVDGNEVLAVLERFDAWGERPEGFVELSGSMV